MQARNSRSGIRRILWILAAVALIVAAMPIAGAAAGETTTVDLIVDGGTDSTTWVDIGEVSVSDDGTDLTVTYLVDEPGWCLTATQVDVAETAPGDFEINKKGSPQIGKFEFKETHDPCVTTHTETIAFSDVGTVNYVAAHADTLQDGGLDALELALPDTVSMVVSHPGTAGTPSYFDTTVTGGTVLDGTYDAYCIDVGHTISPGTTYNAAVYSSYEDVSGIGNIDNPENLDLVNWIINQGFEGTLAGDGKPFTYGDVQRAIWDLIDDTNSTSGLGPWSQVHVDEILAAVAADGSGAEGYEPGCGDLVAVILVPQDSRRQITIAQITFASVEVPCEDREETAWAGLWIENDDGTGTFGDFKFLQDSSWAGYFAYPG